jgi:hypothetical protein
MRARVFQKFSECLLRVPCYTIVALRPAPVLKPRAGEVNVSCYMSLLVFAQTDFCHLD